VSCSARSDPGALPSFPTRRSSDLYRRRTPAVGQVTVLGGGRGASMLAAIHLSLDEMQYLLEKLEIDEVPVVLDARGRYDNEIDRSEEHTSELQSRENLVCRLLLEK